MAAPINVQGLQAFGAMGCDFGARTAVVVGINTSVAIPRGWWLIENAADTIVRFTYDAGSNYITRLANSAVDAIWSDGYSVEFRGGAAGGTAQRSQIKLLG